MNNKLKKKIILGSSLGIVILICGIVYVKNLNCEIDVFCDETYKQQDNLEENEKINQNNNEMDEEISNNNEENRVKEEEIYYIVHVAGEVKKPNKIYKLKKGSRVYDAIELAGGATDKANLELINLAACIEDGQKIYVPNIDEDESELGKYKENNEKINSNNNLININIASKIELMQLNGIGDKTAEKIIDYRTNVSVFKDIADIKNVSGIGDSLFNDIKDKISI